MAEGQHSTATQSAESATGARRLTNAEVSWYAAGALPGGVGALGFSYLVFYYNQVLGIPGSLIGLAAVLVSVFDAVTDPVAGAISDRTRSRLGRRHVYLFSAAVPSAATFYLIWAPPSGWSLASLMAWLVTLHLVKRLIDTFYTVPYLALGAEISTDYEERTRIATTRSVWFHAGRALAGGLLLLVFMRSTEQYPDGQLNPAAYPRFGAFFAVVILVALLSSAWQTKGWVSRLSEAAVEERRRFRDLFGELRLALRFRAFRALLFGSVSRHIAWGVSDSLGIYMATFFWQIDTSLLFLWGVGMFTGTFVGLPFWQQMAKRFDKRPICMTGDGMYLVFFCVPYLLKVVGFWPDHDSGLYVPLYVLTTGFLAHMGIAAPSALMGSMLGDVTDLDELEGGRRREGVLFGAESFAWKAFTGLGPLVAGVVVDLVGLNDAVDPTAVPDAIVNGLGLAQGCVMTLFFALAFLFIGRYDLNRRRHAEILARLGSRRMPAER